MPRMNTKTPLTVRQKRMLDFITKYIADKGYPPALRDIGTALKISSPNGVTAHLKALEKKGYIERGFNLSRAIRVLP